MGSQHVSVVVTLIVIHILFPYICKTDVTPIGAFLLYDHGVYKTETQLTRTTYLRVTAPPFCINKWYSRSYVGLAPAYIAPVRIDIYAND